MKEMYNMTTGFMAYAVLILNNVDITFNIMLYTSLYITISHYDEKQKVYTTRDMKISLQNYEPCSISPTRKTDLSGNLPSK